MPNRRFGTANKFGTSNKFGASSSLGRSLTWALEVDWDADGVFTGYNEATGRILSMNERRGREFLFDSTGNGLQAVDAGEINIVLKNTDRRYDPYFTTGDLFSSLYGNQKLRLRLRDESDGTVYSDFTGYITDIRPTYGMVDTVTITAKDGLRKLKDKNISSSAVSTNVRYDTQITAALTAAGWTDATSIDTTVSDTMSYHWFRGNSAFWEIDQLSQAAFGLFFVDADGTFTYKSAVSSDTSVMTLTEADIDYNYGIQAPAPRDVVKNVVNVYARARKLQSGVELWRMVDIPQIATGTGSPIWASYTYNGESVPAISITEPVATTDYTANDNSDGSGTDRTANFSFAHTGFATSSKLIPTNSGSPAYLTMLKLRGDCITADRNTFAQSSDSASISSYGQRELTIASDWLQDINTAVTQANLLLNRFKQPKLFPRVKIKRSNLTKQYTPELFDLVTINFASREISAEMRLGYIERSWDIKEPNVVDTIMYFEPNLTVSSSGSWIFPVTFPATFA